MPNTSTMASAMRKISMFTGNARSTSGNDWVKMSQLKNCSCTAGQPDDCMTSHTTSATSTTVLTVAIAAALGPPLSPVRSRRMRDRLSPLSRGGYPSTGAPASFESHLA